MELVSLAKEYDQYKNEEGIEKFLTDSATMVLNQRLFRVNNPIFRKIKTNAELSAKDLVKHIKLSDSVKEILNTSAKQLDLSARSYHRIIKLARTIADLDGASDISENHILEALQYRPKRYQGV
jgi:magnesium chelatase family protein